MVCDLLRLSLRLSEDEFTVFGQLWFSAYFLETINATGQALQEVHESMMPIGVPVRYEFGLDGLTANTREYVEPTVSLATCHCI